MHTHTHFTFSEGGCPGPFAGSKSHTNTEFLSGDSFDDHVEEHLHQHPLKPTAASVNEIEARLTEAYLWPPVGVNGEQIYKLLYSLMARRSEGNLTIALVDKLESELEHLLMRTTLLPELLSEGSTFLVSASLCSPTFSEQNDSFPGHASQ